MGNKQSSLKVKVDEKIPSESCNFQNTTNSMNSCLPSGETLLTACIQDRNISCFSTLLKQNADLNVTNRYGDTPLLLSIRAQKTDLVELLLQHPTTDVNQPGRFLISPLQLASISGDVKLVKLLLDKGADPNGIAHAKNCYSEKISNSSTPLQLAIEDEKIAKLLIERGACVNSGFPLYTAIKKKSINVALEILKHENLNVDLLKEQKFDILVAAGRVHSCDLVRGLLEKGVKIRQWNHKKLVEKEWDKEVGLLGCIIHYGCWNCFQYLLKNVDINAKDLHKLTMLHYPLISNGWRCDRLKQENDVHQQCMDYDFCYPREACFKLKSFRLNYAKALLDRGADLTAVWNSAVWATIYRSNHIHDDSALQFCIQVYHCTNELKRQSMFRQIICTNDMKHLAMLYMDGYDPTEEDLTVVQNKMKNKEILNSCSVTPFSVDNIGMLRKMPRTLKCLAVVTIRKSIGPNVYKPVRELALPQGMTDLVLLQEFQGMVPKVET